MISWLIRAFKIKTPSTHWSLVIIWGHRTYQQGSVSRYIWHFNYQLMSKFWQVIIWNVKWGMQHMSACMQNRFWCCFFFNSFPPSVTYMCWWTGSALVQVMAWRWTGDKPLTEPKLIYSQWHKPQIYFPWQTQYENIPNTHDSAYCRWSLGSTLIYINMKTVRIYVQTAINLQRKCLGTPDCRNMKNMLTDFTWLNVQPKYLIQTILYDFKWDMALWKWPKCPQYMQPTWWQTVATQHTGLM